MPFKVKKSEKKAARATLPFIVVSDADVIVAATKLKAMAENIAYTLHKDQLPKDKKLSGNELIAYKVLNCLEPLNAYRLIRNKNM